jgi:DNA-binding response OmpR family regulator
MPSVRLPPRVLVVDDEPAVCDLIVRALEEAGYGVIAVRNGKEGLEAAEPEGFDLVIANDYTPNLSADQLLLHLRRLFPDSPILHLDDLKPFSLNALLGAVAGSLETHCRRPA